MDMYTQFVIGFEQGTFFWLFCSLVVYLYRRSIAMPVKGIATATITREVIQQGLQTGCVQVDQTPSNPTSVLFLALVQGTIGSAPQVSLIEQAFREWITTQPCPSTQPQLVGYDTSSDRTLQMDARIATVQKTIEGFSIRQARALAKLLTKTEAQIVGYSSMSVTDLIEQLTRIKRLQYIAERGIDINALQISSSTNKKKKQKSSPAPHLSKV